MRGKEHNNLLDRMTKGITPAYAGKRVVPGYMLSCPEDHPRLCGEKCKMQWSIFALLGSPPPMRGKGPDSAGQRYIGRITPAYAGKSQNP